MLPSEMSFQNLHAGNPSFSLTGAKLSCRRRLTPDTAQQAQAPCCRGLLLNPGIPRLWREPQRGPDARGWAAEVAERTCLAVRGDRCGSGVRSEERPRECHRVLRAQLGAIRLHRIPLFSTPEQSGYHNQFRDTSRSVSQGISPLSRL